MIEEQKMESLQKELELYAKKESEWMKEKLKYIEKIKELQYKNKLLNCQLNQVKNKDFNNNCIQQNINRNSKLHHQRVKSDQHQNLFDMLSKNNQYSSNEEIQHLLQNKSQKNSSTTNKSLIYLILDNLKNNYQQIKHKKKSCDPLNKFEPFLSTKHTNNKKIHFRSLTSVNNQIQINNDQQGLEVNIKNPDSQNTNIQFIMNLNSHTPNSQINQQIINNAHNHQTIKNSINNNNTNNYNNNVVNENNYNNNNNGVFNFSQNLKYNNLNENGYFCTFNREKNIENINNNQQKPQQMNISQNINYAYLKKKIASQHSNLYNQMLKQSREYNFQKLFTLRSHLDSVRCIKFRENLLISGSEDSLIKVWDLKTMVPNPIPQQTLSGHCRPIMSLDIQKNKKLMSNKIVSGDCAGQLIIWDNHRDNQYQQMMKCQLEGVVWDIQIEQQSQKMIVNDNQQRYFMMDLQDGEFRGYSVNTNEKYGRSQWNQEMLISASLEKKRVWSWDFNVNRRNMYLEYDQKGEQEDNWVNDLKVNGNMVACAHEDKKIRFMDLRTGKVVQTIVGHSDSVSSVAFYFRNTNIFHSGGHEGSLRCWDLRNYSLVSEHQVHQTKYQEGIHSVISHYNSNLVASCGADSIIKIYKGSM